MACVSEMFFIAYLESCCAFKYRKLAEPTDSSARPSFLFYNQYQQAVPPPWELGQLHASHYTVYQKTHLAKGKKEVTATDTPEVSVSV